MAQLSGKTRSRKKARKNTAEWVPHLSQMSNDEIILKLLAGDITPSYRAQLDGGGTGEVGRWSREGCGEAGISAGMEALVRDSHRRRACWSGTRRCRSTWPNWHITQKSLTKNHRWRVVDHTTIFPAGRG